MTGRSKALERRDRRKDEVEAEKRGKTRRAERMGVAGGGPQKKSMYFIDGHGWVFWLRRFPCLRSYPMGTYQFALTLAAWHQLIMHGPKIYK
jgi:hypothetical protein